MPDLPSFLFATSSDYWLTRFVILRLLGLAYFFAFLSLVRQLMPLLGSRGLTPADKFINDLRYYYHSKWRAFWHHPSLFWVTISDNAMRILAWTGFLLSFLVVIGFANTFILIALWVIYISFVHIGQVWYGYGWEGELLETGFLAIFLVPLINPSPFPAFIPPLAIIWLFWWLTFRLHIGAGLIKMRGDQCWKKLTCLYYHFETQPIPNPLSRYFHYLPRVMLRSGVLLSHAAQLIAPFLMIFPGVTRILAGLLMFLLQVILMIGGNYSFLNLIAMVSIVAMFNDEFLSQIMPQFIVSQAADAAASTSSSNHIAAWILFVVVLILSIPVVKNLFSRHQFMNTSFNQFFLVNAYGAFGAIGKERYELIVQGTNEEKITNKTKWKEYEFKGKPGDTRRTPPIIAPYQPRIDWQMWFAAMQTPNQNPWLFHFIWKLLHNDMLAIRLIRHNPFPDHPPKFIRIEFYQYSFAPKKEKRVWDREYKGNWLSPVSKVSLESVAQENGWL